MQSVLGDYAAFYRLQRRRLHALGIDVDGFALSHLAFRTETVDEYLQVRGRLEAHCSANVENVWNGRPISKLLLREPLTVAPGRKVQLIELIPPVHQARYKMGLEHIGFVVGAQLDMFAERHRAVFSGRQFQTEDCQPWFIRFADDTNVKFYARSLMDYCIAEGRRFDGFHHAGVAQPDGTG